MHKTLALFVLTLGLIGLAPVAASAAPGSGTLSTASGVLYGDCTTRTYSYSVQVPAGADSWDLDVDITDGDSGYVFSDYLYRGADPTTGFGTFQTCGYQAAGTWTLKANLETCDYDVRYGSGCTTAYLPTVYFTMREPKTRTRLTASTRNPRFNQTVTLVIKVRKEDEYGYTDYAYGEAFLQVRRDGDWKRVQGSNSSTDGDGRLAIRYRWNIRQSVRMRAVSTADDTTAGAASPAIRIG